MSFSRLLLSVLFSEPSQTIQVRIIIWHDVIEKFYNDATTIIEQRIHVPFLVLLKPWHVH